MIEDLDCVTPEPDFRKVIGEFSDFRAAKKCREENDQPFAHCHIEKVDEAKSKTE